MAKFRKVPESETVFQMHFMCPGCKSIHCINNTWKFNDDYNRPTVFPSVLVTYPPNSTIRYRCHSYIKEGKIEFLNDCTHELKGKTVELPEIDENTGPFMK